MKEIKLIVGAYHELSKELKRVDFVERILQFASKVTPAGCKGFGADYDPKKVVIKKPEEKQAASGKKGKKKWLIILYFIIGLILAIVKRSKRLFLIWPLMPMLKH